MANNVPRESTSWETFKESNFFWGGGVGMVLVAYGFLLAGAPKFSIALLVIGWLVISVSVYEHFFKGRPRVTQIIGLSLISAALAVVFGLIWLSLQPQQNDTPNLSSSLRERLLPIAAYVQTLPWRWIAISLAVGFLLAAWLLRGKANSPKFPKWLRAITDNQRQGLTKYVLVEKCDIDMSPLTSGKRYFELTFHVINYSMFYVSIPMAKFDQVKGTIRFGGDPISREAKLAENRVTGLAPHGNYYFKIWQWVDSDEAKDIPEKLEKVGNLFDFSETIVCVKADEFPNDEEARLDLTRVMQNTKLENENVELRNATKRLNEGLNLWHDRASKLETLYYTLGMFYLAYNQTEQRETLSKDTGNNLKGRFMQALNDCFRVNSIVDAYSDNLPTFPKSFNKQMTWVNAQCFILRRLITEQKQGLADYVKDDPIAPTAHPLPAAQQEGIISKLQAELASLKTLLEEQKDIPEAVSHDLTFEIDTQSTQVKMEVGRDVQRIEANVKLRCFKVVERKVAVREIQASLHRQTSNGEETIVPRNGAVVIYEHPSMNKADAASGWIIDKPISDSRWYMFFIELPPDTAGNLSREHFLRVSLYEGTRQDPFTVDFYVNDWQSARQSNSFITLKP